MAFAALSRRTFLRHAPAAAAVGALVSVPVVATAGEHPNEKVRRLSKEMSEALRDPRFIGFNRITVTPESVMSTDNDPETRIAYAIEDIRAAIAVDHPDWKFQIEDRSIGVIQGTSHVESAPRRRGILLYASDEKYGPEKARFFVDYVSVRDLDI